MKSRPPLPFGDPCPRCGASSDNPIAYYRKCDCDPCPTCKMLTGNLCGYCDQSLGCIAHRIEIEDHVASGACPQADQDVIAQARRTIADRGQVQT